MLYTTGQSNRLNVGFVNKAGEKSSSHIAKGLHLDLTWSKAASLKYVFLKITSMTALFFPFAKYHQGDFTYIIT